MFLRSMTCGFILLVIGCDLFSPTLATDHQDDIQKLTQLVIEVEELQNKIDLMPTHKQEALFKRLEDSSYHLLLPMSENKLLDLPRWKFQEVLCNYKNHMREVTNGGIDNSYIEQPRQYITYLELNINVKKVIDELYNYTRNFSLSFQIQFFIHSKHVLQFYLEHLKCNLEEKYSVTLDPFSSIPSLALPNDLNELKTLEYQYTDQLGSIRANQNSFQSYKKLLFFTENTYNYSQAEYYYSFFSPKFAWEQAILTIFGLFFSKEDLPIIYKPGNIESNARQTESLIKSFIEYNHHCWLTATWQCHNWGVDRIEKFQKINERAVKFYLKSLSLLEKNLAPKHKIVAQAVNNALSKQKTIV